MFMRAEGGGGSSEYIFGSSDGCNMRPRHSVKVLSPIQVATVELSREQTASGSKACPPIRDTLSNDSQKTQIEFSLTYRQRKRLCLVMSLDLRVKTPTVQQTQKKRCFKAERAALMRNTQITKPRYLQQHRQNLLHLSQVNLISCCDNE